MSDDKYCFICQRFTSHRSNSCPDRVRYSFPFLYLTAALLLTGCAGTPPPPQQVRVIADTYCAATKDITWSVTDTSTTTDAVRRANAGRQAKCGARK